METDKMVLSELHMDKLLFEKIEFKRQGLASDKELQIKIQSQIAQKDEEDIYKITLTIIGSKPEEYSFEVVLAGIFSFDSEIDPELRKTLIEKNAVAIMMPYMRSQVSLLTAQPGVECVILPPFNINLLLDK